MSGNRLDRRGMKNMFRTDFRSPRWDKHDPHAGRVSETRDRGVSISTLLAKKDEPGRRGLGHDSDVHFLPSTPNRSKPRIPLIRLIRASVSSDREAWKSSDAWWPVTANVWAKLHVGSDGDHQPLRPPMFEKTGDIELTRPRQGMPRIFILGHFKLYLLRLPSLREACPTNSRSGYF